MLASIFSCSFSLSWHFAEEKENDNTNVPIKKRKGFGIYLVSILFPFFLSIVFILYLHNITGDIYGGDVGDFVTSSVVGGVAHPPGYPTFTFIGFLLTKIPLPLLPVSKVALISLFASLGSLLLLKKIAAFFTENKYIQLLSCSILAFTYLFWLYSELPEVFILNIFFSLCVVYFLLKYHYTKKNIFIFAVAFFYGLGATNHQTIFLTAPLLIAVLVSNRRDIIKLKYRLFFLPTVFILGLIPYVYVPIASYFQPAVNWDNVNSLKSFMRLVLRQDYGTFSAGFFPTPFAQAKLIIQKTYAISLFQSLTLPVILIAIIGLVRGLRTHRVISIGIFLSFLLAGPFFIVYAGFPLVSSFVLGASERFYLLSEVLLLIFLPLGFESIYLFLQKTFSKKIYAKIILGVFILIPILLVKVNFQKTNLSQTRMGTNFAADYLKNLPKGAILLLSGDTRSFNTWYVYYVLHIRNDVHILQIGNFGISDSYYDSVAKKLAQQSGLSGSNLFLNSVLKIAETKKVYSMQAFRVPPQNYEWVQTGFSYQLFKKDEVPTESEYKKMLSQNLENLSIPHTSSLLPSERSLILSSIPPYYAGAMSSIGNTFVDKYNDLRAAKVFYDSAVLIDPTESSAYYGLTKIFMSQQKCEDAQDNAKKAVIYAPYTNLNYQLWYENSKKCNESLSLIKYIASVYKDKFGQDIDVAIKSANEKTNTSRK